MPEPEPGADEPPGETQFHGTAVRDQKATEPDTEVVVTDQVVSVRPIDSDRPEFVVPLEEVRRMHCDGFLCRSITLETSADSYEVPAFGLDEGALRRVIAEHSHLSNDCVRLNLDRFGLCPCTVGTNAGCALCVVGIALVLSVVGALLGAIVLAAGIALLGLAYASRKCSQIRGANVWEREVEGDATT
ncbi:MAG: hypothetical protein ACLFNC_01165 [Halodesulfurarchaeum sp.]